jgi:cyclopropane-fatty-acyl-phospholipid synthase
MAERYPNSRITALSNSHSQRAYIEAQAVARGLRNLEVMTCDFNDFDSVRQFDRIVSVEMFEHLRNWPLPSPRWLRGCGPQGSSSCMSSFTAKRPTPSKTTMPATG